uniref:Uncharacterized protein n=1 Tax=viral metagenome TaxID=1070528 RepID=A0A6M3JUG2_9ZZZZ
MIIDNEKKVTLLFEQVKARCLAWMKDNPTGKFSFEIFVNQGGVRERPQISITETLK